jgi:phenylalanyl-tRNA synthetase alpha chain
MDIEAKKIIVESLSPIERKLIPLLAENSIPADSLANEDIDKTTILRAAEYLKKKKLVEIEGSEGERIELGVFGVHYQKNHLPERVLLNTIDKEKEVMIKDIKKKTGLNDNEAKVALGTLKKKALIDLKDGKLMLNAKPEEVSKRFMEEVFLGSLPRELSSLEPEEKFALENLRKRKEIVEIVQNKETSIKLTSDGLEIQKEKLDIELLEQLTPQILKGNGFKNKKFRRYDLTAGVPRIYGGKRHFVNQAMDHAKSIWLEMGFKEMSGNNVESGFWVFDSLFTAQDHPVREMQDTFYLKNAKAKLPDKKIVDAVKKAHEGGIDGSSGWNQEWKEEGAKKVLLRTHTTSLSARKLMEIGKDLENNVPVKYFALDKCFRNETVDWSHGFEFIQTEGIVIDENANFKQLIGYLTEFYKKMGYEKVRVRPAYFAYTEPSLEVDVFHPVHKKWVELGGAGMFRPEVTIPMFGRHIPVLAWGQGMDRIIMEYFGITDLRDMFKNDINQLREMKFWRRG